MSIYNNRRNFIYDPLINSNKRLNVINKPRNKSCKCRKLIFEPLQQTSLRRRNSLLGLWIEAVSVEISFIRPLQYVKEIC